MIYFNFLSHLIYCIRWNRLSWVVIFCKPTCYRLAIFNLTRRDANGRGFFSMQCHSALGILHARISKNWPVNQWNPISVNLCLQSFKITFSSRVLFCHKITLYDPPGGHDPQVKIHWYRETGGDDVDDMHAGTPQRHRGGPSVFPAKKSVMS